MFFPIIKNGKTDMEAGKYALSIASSYGKYGRQKGK